MPLRGAKNCDDGVGASLQRLADQRTTIKNPTKPIAAVTRIARMGSRRIESARLSLAKLGASTARR